MNIKKGILLGVLMYICSFLIGLALIYFSGSYQSPAILLWGGVVILVVLSAIFSLWYFYNEKAHWKQGLSLGLIFDKSVFKKIFFSYQSCAAHQH